MDPDRQLVERTLAGEMQAFEELMELHGAVAFRVAARVVGRESAEDVTQEAFLRAFHRLDRFRSEGSFRSWLLQITHNTALNARARRVPEPVGAADDVAGATPAPMRGPASALEDEERRERLERKLEELTEQHRVVLVLRDLEGLAYEEIAEVTNSPLGSVKGRLHRARQELIEILRHNSYDWELPE